MEGLAIATACLTLTKAAKSIGKTTREIYNAWDGAPEELADVATKIDILRKLLDGLRSLQTGLTDDEEEEEVLSRLDPIKSALSATWKVVVELQKACQYQLPDTKVTTRARIRWAFLEKRKVVELLAELRATEGHLMLAMKPLELYISLQSRLLLQSMVAQHDAQLSILANAISPIPYSEIDKHNAVTPICDYQEKGNPVKDIVPQSTSATHTVIGDSVRLHQNSWFDALGLACTIWPYWDENKTTYLIWLKYQFPKFFGNRVFVTQLTVRRYFYELGLRFPRASMTVRNVLPPDSAIFTACSRGDVDAVRKLFTTRTATPHDMTADDLTPLFFAIRSGSYDTVKYLLDVGADPNWAFGSVQTSPLQLAIRKRFVNVIQCLLTAGACTEYLDARGWPVLFYMWERLKSPTSHIVSTETLVGILSARQSLSNFDFDARDEIGNSTLGRAKALGGPSDVDILLRYGAHPSGLHVPFKFTSFKNATCPGNGSFMSEVADQESELNNVKIRDVSGWTLLQIAAQSGDEALIKRLLDAGADPHELCKPAGDDVFDIPDELKNKALSATEIAEESGVEQRDRYLRALRSSRLDVVVDDEGEVFWPPSDA
ncbi:hypothetical protein FQN54_005303 [Arachnomyces sp. PD_36]|nr:hypothetical protein FQN54_005303 [Arachnomyces sp. PD_36]